MTEEEVQENQEEGPKTVYGGFDAELSLDMVADNASETVIIRPELPMSIAILGAPDVGKRDVIEEFVKLATPWLAEQKEEIVTIDNPAFRISELGQAMGQFGGYREGLWAVFNRLEREREAEVEGKSSISSGTVLEALAHLGVNYEVTMLGSDSGIITPETQNELQKIQVAMTVLTFLFIDGFRYKFAFYVPRSQSIIIPGQDETMEERHSRRVDAALVEIFRNFQLRIQVLDQPTNAERAQAAFDTIKNIYEEGVEVPRSLAPPEAVV